jgi:predicted  nucleic acid-binding Zn-ribbon protein
MTIDARLTSLDEALVNLWGNVLRMQIAHRKTQSDHRMLSDRTDALAARLDAVQADLRGPMRSDDEVEALRARVQAAEDLLSDLQGRLSTAEAALAEAKAQAEAQAAEWAAKVVEAESDASPAIATTITPPITPTRKRKRTEDDVGEVEEDGNIVRGGKDEGEEEQGNSVVRACCPKVQARKRPRRLVRAAVQVTAAATIGAVAAWSALAFV